MAKVNNVKLIDSKSGKVDELSIEDLAATTTVNKIDESLKVYECNLLNQTATTIPKEEFNKILEHKSFKDSATTNYNIYTLSQVVDLDTIKTYCFTSLFGIFSDVLNSDVEFANIKLYLFIVIGTDSNVTVRYFDKNFYPVTLQTLYDLIKGSSGIVVDKAESNDHLEVHLDYTVFNKLERTLITPTATPSQILLPAIDTTNAQTNLKIGDGLTIDGDTLKATGGGGGSGSGARFLTVVNKVTMLFQERQGLMYNYSGTMPTGIYHVTIYIKIVISANIFQTLPITFTWYHDATINSTTFIEGSIEYMQQKEIAIGNGIIASLLIANQTSDFTFLVLVNDKNNQTLFDTLILKEGLITVVYIGE